MSILNPANKLLCTDIATEWSTIWDVIKFHFGHIARLLLRLLVSYNYIGIFESFSPLLKLLAKLLLVIVNISTLVSFVRHRLPKRLLVYVAGLTLLRIWTTLWQ